MNKERTAFDPNGVIVFNRDITIEDFGIIPKSFHGDIVVNGDCNLYSQELNKIYDLILNASIWCTGAIIADNIKVNGDVFAAKEIHCDDLIVSGDISCNDEVDCERLQVMGDFFCEGYFYAAKSIKVAGKFECIHDMEC